MQDKFSYDFENILFSKINKNNDINKEEFISPKYRLGNVWAFNGMNIAVDRIFKAITNKEKVTIYADYDCDGIPAAVILFDLFKLTKSENLLTIYIPDRHNEGYGMTKKGISSLKEKGVSLIITVDLGITAIEEVSYANEIGIDVIVTDHHNCLSEYPRATAVIHPENGEYENKYLCGAGVAFMLTRAFIEKYGRDFEIKDGSEKWLLDLVAFATLSDMVPLIGENRLLVQYGLYVMKKTRRIGIKTILNKNKIYLNSLTETDLTFTLAPRLNAASRMSNAELAFKLLSTDDLSEAETIARELEKINTQRKTLVARVTKDAYKIVENRNVPEIVVVGNPEWKPSILGLVANKLQEKFKKSFFVWGLAGDGNIKGSCRMCKNHNATDLMKSLPDGMLLHSGGHKMAGGFCVHKDHIHFLEKELNDVLSKTENLSSEDSSIDNKILLELKDVNNKNLSIIRKFAPFGVGNPEFDFLFENLIVKEVKMFGKNKEHLECVVSDGVNERTAYRFFANQELIDILKVKNKINLSGFIENGYLGRVQIRINNVDLL